MKKFVILGLLTVTTLGVSVQKSHANLLEWLFGKCKCYTHIKVQPYNAFTPVCSGTLTCIGCNPLVPAGGHGHGFGHGVGHGFPGYWGPGCCDFGALPAAENVAPGDGGKSTQGSEFTPPDPNSTISIAPTQVPQTANPYLFTGQQNAFYGPAQGYNPWMYNVNSYGINPQYSAPYTGYWVYPQPRR